MEIKRTRIVLNKSSVNFASNDYLGVADNPMVKTAIIQAIEKYGASVTSSPLVSGYSEEHAQLEEIAAKYYNRQKAIVFSSGYLANIGVINCIAKYLNINDALLDQYCHASIIDGVLLSKLKFKRFMHNKYYELNKYITEQKSLIIAESIYSMEGDIIDRKIIDNKPVNSILYIDDAHGIGINNYIKQYNSNIDFLVTPAGKALGGIGAVVTGSNEFIDLLINYCRSYIYNTALPPHNVAGLIKAFEIIEKERWRQEFLFKNINYFIQRANQFGLKLIDNSLTPIKSILIGNNNKVMEIKNKLAKKNIIIGAIRPPTVPVGTARLRVSLNCFHTFAEIDYLLNSLVELMEIKDEAIYNWH